MNEFSDDQLLGAIRKWQDESKLEAAQKERSASRWQRQLAGEEMRLHGLLLDLQERRTAIQLQTREQRTLAGLVHLVGQDFCVITSHTRASVLLNISTIVGVQIPGNARNSPVPSAREPIDAPGMIDVLNELAGNRTRVRFLASGNQEVRTGELFAIGNDIATLHIDSSPSQVLFVPLTQFSELSIVP